MDKGVDAKHTIMGEEIPMKLGYVGVVNRSQKDINTKLRVKNALENEKLFFSKTPP